MSEIENIDITSENSDINEFVSESIFDTESPPDDNTIKIQQLLDKKRVQLSKLTPDELNKLFQPTKRTNNKKNKYTLQLYNFNTKLFDNINSFKTNGEIKQYLKDSNINASLGALLKTNIINIIKL